VHNEGQPDSESGAETTRGPARYAFTPPPAPTNIEFRRVRRVSSGFEPSSRHKGRNSRRWVVIPAACLVLVLVLSVGLFGLHGLQAKNHLQVAAGLFAQLEQQISNADVTAARGTLTALQAETKAAYDATDGLGWRGATHLPLIGDDLAAVATVSAVLDDLAENGLPALLDVASGLDPASLAPRDGRVNLAALDDAAPRIAGGLAVIRRAQQNVAGIRTDGLVAQLDTAVAQLAAGLAKAERLTETADRAARLLPTMLGSTGSRTYLVLFQNSAEVRATGGMPGAYIVVNANAGAIKIVDQGTASGDLQTFDPPVQKLDDNMVGLYTDLPAVFPADVNLTPDFPTAARLMRAMYFKRKGLLVDGVMATDPIALSYLLRATGAVQVPEGEPLTSNNAVRVLLSEAYVKYPDPSVQDAYFAGAARAIFGALLHGRANPKVILTELARAAGERRLLVWSADQKAEAILVGTVLAGRMPDDDGSNPTVGVFLNDGSGAKLSYYLTQAATLSGGDCAEDGSRELHLKLTMGSTAPRAGLPAYVTGSALSGRPYTSRTMVMVFSPTGGAVVGVRRAGKELDFGSGLERDRGVAVIPVDLPPGSSKTYDVVIQTGILPVPGQAIFPRLWTTPGVRPWRTAVAVGTKC
jgi:hypothetical protein